MSDANEVDGVILHSCEPKWTCDTDKKDGYGVAIEECHETESGELWAGNGEYSTRINYCPFCGYKANNQIITS